MQNVEWVPIVLFIGMTIVISIMIWFRFKSRVELQTTIRAILDKGQELSPELIDRLGHPKPAKDKDFRLGIIWVAVAIGITAFGFGIPDDDEVASVFMGISALPLMMGIAYLILHKFSDRD